MESTFVPGAFVRHPERPDWGVGQVQSAVGTRVTVNFEHAGKVLLDVARVALTPSLPPRLDDTGNGAKDDAGDEAAG